MFVEFLLLSLLQTVLKPILGQDWVPAVLGLGEPWFDPGHAQGEGTDGTDSAQADVATLGKGGGIAVCGFNNPCSTQSLKKHKGEGAAAPSQERGHKPCPQTEGQICQYKIIHVFLGRG